MTDYQELKGEIRRSLEELSKFRELCMTQTEKMLLDGRIIDLQRLNQVCYKIENKEVVDNFKEKLNAKSTGKSVSENQ